MGSIFNEYISIENEVEKKYGRRSVLLMMVGSFYEMYGDGGENAYEKLGNISKLLNIQLTCKNKALQVSKDNPHLAGFPCYSLPKHLSKLLHNNYTVCVYDQYDDENKRGAKIRKEIGTYSPGTYVEEELNESSGLMCVNIDSYICPIENTKKMSAYLSYIDLSTGNNKIFECFNDIIDQVNRFIQSLNPCEIVFNGDLDANFDFGNRLLHSNKKIDSKYKDTVYQEAFLSKIYGKNDLVSIIEYLGLERNGELLACFIQLIQFAYEHDPNIVTRIEKPQFINTNNELLLNNDALFQLNLVTGDKTLLSIINHTKTKMGFRLLRERLLHPITDIDEIEQRYDLIEKVMHSHRFEAYENKLKCIIDLEKKFRKLALNKLHPYELANLQTSFKNSLDLLRFSISDFNVDEKIIDDFSNFINDYEKTFNIKEMEYFGLNNIKSSFFNKGVDKEIDKLNSKIDTIKNIFIQVASELSRLIDNGYDDLIKIGSNDKEGYHLTTTCKRWETIKKKEWTSKVAYNGKNLVFKLTDMTVKKLTNSVKITSPLLEKLSDILLSKISNIKILVKNQYLVKLENYEKIFGNNFREVVKTIGEIDLVNSCAVISNKYVYTRPHIDRSIKKSFVKFQELRHPIIERIQSEKEYVTNDIENCNILLYGLNSSGKSSLIRAVGTNIILAQMGMFVSAKEMNFYPFKNLLCKISTTDNLFKGQSTFIVEMLELKNILKKADNSSLVLCDELTSGTETKSATGIVASTLLRLVERESNFIFTTHLHSLVDFEDISNNSGIDIYHFNIKISDKNVEYERKLIKGSGDDTYGIEIANALGLDSQFIKKAFEFRSKLDGINAEILSNKRSRYNKKVIVDACEKCGTKKNLHTHHISHQKDSNKNGNIGHFHKNTPHNLMILCETCHAKIHKNS